jgi:hypothetical protein
MSLLFLDMVKMQLLGYDIGHLQRIINAQFSDLFPTDQCNFLYELHRHLKSCDDASLFLFFMQRNLNIVDETIQQELQFLSLFGHSREDTNENGLLLEQD